MSTTSEIPIAILYSSKDKALFEELETHLKNLQGASIWHEGDIQGGQSRGKEIDKQLRKAQIILLCISPDFVVPDNDQLQTIEERYKAGVTVIPIIFRKVKGSTQFSELQPLPRNGHAIANQSRQRRNEILVEVVEDLQKMVNSIEPKIPTNSSAQKAIGGTESSEASSPTISPPPHEEPQIVTDRLLSTTPVASSEQEPTRDAKPSEPSLPTILPPIHQTNPVVNIAPKPPASPSRFTWRMWLVALSVIVIVSSITTWLIVMQSASPTPTPPSQSITATLPLCQGNTIVHSVAWSPNGQLLASATASDDGKTGAICIWNRKTGQSIPTTIGSLLPVFSISWSPNSQFIAAGGYDYTGTIQIWDINHPDAPLRTYKPSTGKISTVYAISWSPDGKSLASGGPDQTIRIWDPSITETNATPLVQKQYTGAIFSIDWAPDGTRLALGLNNGTAQIINAQTGSALSVLPSHQHSTVGAVAWSPDGAHLASGNWDGTIQMWDPATGTLLFTDSGHTDAVGSIAWSPDNAFIVSGSNDTTVRIWDVHAPGPARFVYTHHKNQVHAVSWSPTADVIASGDFSGIVQIWSPFEN